MAIIYLCPAEKHTSCNWEGDPSEIKRHFEEEHQDLLLRTNSIEVDLERLPQNKLLHLDGELYLLQNYATDGKLGIKLRYLGSSATAAKFHYDVIVTVKNISYKYEPSRFFSCVVPKPEEWEVNVDSLERFHGKIQTLTCTLLLEDGRLGSVRKISDASLKINNSFVEKHACDETEANYLDALSLLDSRLEELKLKQQEEEEDQKEKKRESGDIMDRISQLDFSLLEEPFAIKYEEYRKESETLSYIPEEVNLSCPSCRLDMLPPIYLCSNGHNVCSWCKSKPCQICNFAISDTRNTELENISRMHLHQCRYSSEGCNEKFNYTEVRAHEARCHFCKYKCMSRDCPFEGKFEPFANHLKVVHSSTKIGQTTKNEFPKNYEMYVVNRAIGIFYCKSEVSDDFITWRATFCGPKERQFFCDIAFKGSKYKEPIYLKRRGHVYEIKKPVAELKRNKAKEKYAVLNIVSYDS